MNRRTGNGTVGLTGPPRPPAGAHERARRRGRRIKAYPIGELAPVRSPSVRARGAKTIPVCSLALRAGSSSLPHPIPLRTGRSCLVTDPRRIKLAGAAGCLALPPRALRSTRTPLVPPCAAGRATKQAPAAAALHGHTLTRAACGLGNLLRIRVLRPRARHGMARPLGPSLQHVRTRWGRRGTRASRHRRRPKPHERGAGGARPTAPLAVAPVPCPPGRNERARDRKQDPCRDADR